MVNASAPCLLPPCALGAPQPVTEQPLYALTGDQCTCQRYAGHSCFYSQKTGSPLAQVSMWCTTFSVWRPLTHWKNWKGRDGVSVTRSGQQLLLTGEPRCTLTDTVSGEVAQQAYCICGRRDRYDRRACCRVPYIIHLLRHGLGVPQNQTRMASGKEAWTLGAALSAGSKPGAGPHLKQGTLLRQCAILLASIGWLLWVAVLCWALQTVVRFSDISTQRALLVITVTSSVACGMGRSYWRAIPPRVLTERLM